MEIAAQRGEKGFSRLVQEALNEYLRRLNEKDAAVDTALEAIGSLSDRAADRMEASAEEIRRRWR